MTIVETYGKEIVAIAIPLITWVLNTFFKAKAKLLLASPHTFTFLVQQPLVDADGNRSRPHKPSRLVLSCFEMPDANQRRSLNGYSIGSHCRYGCVFGSRR